MPPMLFEWRLLLDAIPSFTSGQYWAGVLQNAVGCTVGSFAAILASYWIYRLTTRNDRANRANETRDVLVYFKQTMETVIKIAKHQTENVKAYCDAIQQNDVELPFLSFLPMYSLKRIAEGTSLDRILVAYIQQFPGENDVKEFERLISAVEYFLAQFLLLPEEMRATRSYDHERKIQYQKLFKEAYDLLGLYIITNDPKLNTEFGHRVGQLTDELRIHHTDNYDISFYDEYFFAPLNELLVNYLPTLRPNPDLDRLGIMTRDGKGLFDYIKAQNRVSMEQMAELLPGLYQSIQKFEQNASKILHFS